LQVNYTIVPLSNGSSYRRAAALSAVEIDELKDKLKYAGKVSPDIRVAVFVTNEKQNAQTWLLELYAPTFH
jgi:hypothetical protein